MATKAITNQRTKKEIREEVAKIDKEVPDTKEFVKIMEGEEQAVEEPIEETEEVKETEETPETEETEETEETIEVEETEETPAKKPEPKKELPPIEERYREAGQEAMILNSKLTKVAETVEAIENLPEPTVEELKEYAKQMGEDYENLDTFAQNMLKENFKNKKGLGKITGLFSEEKKVGEWIKKIEDFIDAEATLQAYPGLDALRDEFIRYASKKTHIGADFDLLIAGFMFKQPVKKTPSGGSVLLPSGRGGAGQPKAPAKAELTEDDAAVYRKSDPKKYKQMIKKKKFTITV